MNTLVIYDSKFGNTERIAQTIADTLREFGEAHAVKVADANPLQVERAELVILGAPTQAWHVTKPMRAFVEMISAGTWQHVALAVFDTRLNAPSLLTGSAARNLQGMLKRVGARLLVPPESFIVTASEGPLLDGELDRATNWAYSVQRKFEIERPRVLEPREVAAHTATPR